MTPDPDGRHIVVDGRRWRATDPAIPPALRAELVAELMAARRAVGAATRTGTEAAGDAVAGARARVQDAKVALGERGESWWEPSEAGRRRRMTATVRALLRARAEGSSICPSDVARVVGGDKWRPLVPVAREVAAELVAAGEVEVTQRGQRVDVATARGPVRLRRGSGWSHRST